MSETGLVDRLRVIADKLLELDRDWQRDIYEAADALAAKEGECGELRKWKSWFDEWQARVSDLAGHSEYASWPRSATIENFVTDSNARISTLQEQVRGMRREALEEAAKIVETLYQGGDYGGKFRVSPEAADYFTVRKRVLDIAAQALRAKAALTTGGELENKNHGSYGVRPQSDEPRG